MPLLESMMKQRPRTQSSAAGNNNKKVSAGDLALDRLLDLAEYELKQDAYRGMLSNTNSPWSQCRYCDEADEDEQKVWSISHCTCPCLVEWTQQNDAQANKRKKRKRKKGPESPKRRLGRRMNDATMRFACDYNPFCLASLGGVMDDLLEEAAKQVLMDDESTESEEETEVIDIDADTDEDDGGGKPRAKKRAKIEKVPQEVTSAKPAKSESTEMELDPTKENSIYNKVTAEELKQVRQTCQIDVSSVQSYVEETVLANVPHETSTTLVGYMEDFRKWHESLSFSNPLLTNTPTDSSDKLTISVPPGIRNLGATCYLNTQFQCLAQITAFTDGIFSWTPPDEDHHMNSVLAHMQLLLARMVHGSEATVTTQEFSSALGLETDEMQDPNEFGRLLLERMHESFVGGGLENLLPKLFQGVYTFETTCLTCQTTTERDEPFMDWRLPIVHPDVAAKKKSGGQLSIEEAFVGGAADTNVQHCMNRSICAEELSGENQYWCGTCDAKCDAIRKIQFKRLPPVLNLQLNRYVFDQKKCVKKKLSDKVLLPMVLTVPKKGKKEETKYLLCAVMRHHGTTPYGGHYTAEAMDWQSGTWFEFNDEKVSVLDGPGCSYTPGESEGKKKKKPKGSKDAYNMYYVEESFLAQCASGFFAPDKLNGKGKTAVLAKVTEECGNRYSMLTEMCLNDGKVAHRLNQRRTGLKERLSKELVSAVGSIAFGRSSTTNDDMSSESKPPVWVDGDALRRFMSCDKTTSYTLDISPVGPLLKHKHLLCEHKTGLHPRVARRGKLLPRPLYDAYVSIMLSERRLIMGDEGSVDSVAFDDDDVNDCIITPDSNMYCKNCADSYKAELAEKVKAVKQLKRLCDDLDPKKKLDFSSDDSNDEHEPEPDELDFLLAKKFVSLFRNRVTGVVKKLGTTELHSQLKGRDLSNTNIEADCEGIDALDISEFGLEGKAGSKQELDPLVNSNISCPHGDCNLPNGRAVRKVSQDVWKSLTAVFPKAICHPVSKGTKNNEIRCELCAKDESADEELSDMLIDWFSASSTSALSVVAKKRRSMDDLAYLLLVSDSDDLSVDSKEDASDTLYLVHREDVDLWRAALKRAKTNNGRNVALTMDKLRDLLFPQRDKVVLPASAEKTSETRQDRPDDFNYKGWCPRALMCDAHGLPVEKAVFKADLDLVKNASANPITHISSFVEVLTKAEHSAFVRSIFDLGILLFPNDTVDGESDSAADEYNGPNVPPSFEKLLCTLRKAHHPGFLSPLVSLKANPPGAQPHGDYRDRLDAHVVGGVCRDAKCNDHFLDRNAQTIAEIVADDDAKQVSVIDDECTVVEKPPKSSFALRVYEVESDVELRSVASTMLGLTPAGNSSSGTENPILRRSSRRRKGTYPSGHILREDVLQVSAQNNIAAVRLLLYEKCPGFRIDQTLSMVIPSGIVSNGVDPGNHVDMTKEVNDSPTIPEFILHDLLYKWNDRSLQDILANATEGQNSVPSGLLSEIFLFRHDEPKEKGKDSSPVSNETLMDALFEISNISDSPAAASGTSKGKRGAKRQSAERGFRGTLLHSSAPRSSDANEDEAAAPSKSDVSDEGDKISAPPDAKRSKPNPESKKTHTIDDDGPCVDSGKHKKPKPCESHVLVVDESSDDEEKKEPSVTSPARPVHLIQDDDAPSVLVSHTSNPSSPKRRLRSGTFHPREEDLIAELTRVVTEFGDHPSLTRCRSAAKWAIENGDGKASLSELADKAFAKYLAE